MQLPPNHPDRFALADEVHARPPEALTAPVKLTYLALLSDRTQREEAWRQVADLAKAFGARPPDAEANHYSADFGPFRLKWERHTEFSRYKFIAAENGGGAVRAAGDHRGACGLGGVDPGRADGLSPGGGASGGSRRARA